jgi:UDP-galactopyranose mutase
MGTPVYNTTNTSRRRTFMEYNYVVVGAGMAGATAARALADAGKKVLVIEKNDHIAGHCHDYKNTDGITVHTYGPHIFHTNDKDAWEWANRFTNFIYYQHRVLSYAHGRYIPFPINRDTIAELFGTELSINEVQQFLQDEIEHSSFELPLTNFRDAVVSQVGETLYQTFFENYTRKQWGRDPEELSADLAKRIPVRNNRDDRYFSDVYQGIPASGYTGMISNMLDHPEITVQLKSDYLKVRSTMNPEMTVYTGEIDRFFDYCFGKLEYRSLRLEFRTYEQKQYQRAAVVNYPNDYDWTRITEFKQLSGEISNRTTLCFEYPSAEGEPYYIVPDDRNSAMRDEYMEKAAELEDAGTHLFIGRLAEYTYYNMDQVITATLQKINKLL